jgi:hypothetical protein
VGYLNREFAALGVDFDERAERVDEAGRSRRHLDPGAGARDSLAHAIEAIERFGEQVIAEV